MADAKDSQENKETKEKDEKKVKKKKITKTKADSRKSSAVPPVENVELPTTGNQATEVPIAKQEINFAPTEEEFIEKQGKKKKLSLKDETEKGETEKSQEEVSQNVSQATAVDSVITPKKKVEVPVSQEQLDFRKLAELKEAFHLFDINKDGVIDLADLKFTFASLGKPDIPEEQLQQMLNEMPDPVDFDAFVMLFGYKATELDPEFVLLEALSKWDYEGNGMIAEERIRHDLQTWGDKFTKREVDYALEEAPLYTKKGITSIDYIKFCNNICGFRNVQKSRKIEKQGEDYEKELGRI
ncbi:myosin regulatory light chain, striated muscle, 25 kDa isoform [Cephus cinctus]|uniref:Myosin regulatory light chain, striated muscle, 25 kDa isoform n=1 Tax=Cephus cinctus TaxID=211228 RepID=A0AAJ7FL66_CEPCN|nr:myosin regulatory light chain, striated muscle, 25 kDa isoform [Cephus cinctus]